MFNLLAFGRRTVLLGVRVLEHLLVDHAGFAAVTKKEGFLKAIEFYTTCLFKLLLEHHLAPRDLSLSSLETSL